MIFLIVYLIFETYLTYIVLSYDAFTKVGYMPRGDVYDSVMRRVYEAFYQGNDSEIIRLIREQRIREEHDIDAFIA
jgi:hypothetical protein